MFDNEDKGESGFFVLSTDYSLFVLEDKDKDKDYLG